MSLFGKSDEIKSKKIKFDLNNVCSDTAEKDTSFTIQRK